MIDAGTEGGVGAAGGLVLEEEGGASENAEVTEVRLDLVFEKIR